MNWVDKLNLVKQTINCISLDSKHPLKFKLDWNVIFQKMLPVNRTGKLNSNENFQ